MTAGSTKMKLHLALAAAFTLAAGSALAKPPQADSGCVVQSLSQNYPAAAGLVEQIVEGGGGFPSFDTLPGTLGQVNQSLTTPGSGFDYPPGSGNLFKNYADLRKSLPLAPSQKVANSILKDCRID